MIDIHTHILPGLDDGARDLDESLAMAETALRYGVSALVATPHIANGDPLWREKIQRQVDHLSVELEKQGIPLKVFLGAEYRADYTLFRHLEGGGLVTINDTGKYLLLELPFQAIPRFWGDLIFELGLKGLASILCHPERNEDLMSHPDELIPFVERDVFIQVNLGSLAGLYGSRARKTARYLLEHGLVHLLASDSHNPGLQRNILGKGLARLGKWVSEEEVRIFTEENPRRVIEGEPLIVR
jgi:protein-tyrosine phosphatase